MERLKELIKEVLSRPIKEDTCNCGCDSCSNVGNPGVVLNESLTKKSLLSEHLRYHVDNKLPLTENTFRYGSEAFLDLWRESRAMYLREVIHVNDLDKEILEETDLGNYGMFEGKKVPLDMPMLNEGRDAYCASCGEHGYDEDLDRPCSNCGEDDWSTDYEGLSEELTTDHVISTLKKLDKDAASMLFKAYKEGQITAKQVVDIANKTTNLNEAEFKGKKVSLNKPKRGGSKAYYVYVNSGKKTKDGKVKAKKVSFGSGGLKAKINDKDARTAFAKRHKCGQGEKKTSPKWWSCRLPSFAKQLGLKSSYTGFW